MSAPVLPIVHRNGTSREALIAERADACRAVREAQRALALMSPNARDYYPEPGLFERARAQHDARVAALDAVYDGIEAEAIALDEGGTD